MANSQGAPLHRTSIGVAIFFSDMPEDKYLCIRLIGTLIFLLCLLLLTLISYCNLLMDGARPENLRWRVVMLPFSDLLKSGGRRTPHPLCVEVRFYADIS